jgi:predicted amidohydrolase YtcJ
LSAAAASSSATLAIVNAKVLTQSALQPTCEAVAIRDGRIVRLGGNDEVREACGRDALVLDAEGSTVTPGFIDAHAHWGLVAVSLMSGLLCPSPPYGSIAEIVAAGRRVAAQTPRGEWIVLQGSSMQGRVMAEGRTLASSDLDAISTEHPILYKSNLHQLVVNQRALDDAGIDATTVPPVGAVIERDLSGRPTGNLGDMYTHLPIPRPDPAELRAVLSEVAWSRLLASGVTGIHEIVDSADVMAVQRDLIGSRDVPLRMLSYVWVPEVGTMKDVLDSRGDFGAEPEWFELGGVKLFADGGTSSRTAAVHAPYPGTTETGALTFEHAELVELIAEAHAAGAQLVIHATGDRGQDAVLAAYEDAGAAGAAARRHRIEHAGNVLWTRERAERFKALEILPVPNIGFLYDYAEAWPATFGDEVARGCLPLRTMLDQGFPVAGTSDTTGGSLPALDALANIRRAVTRRTMSGQLVGPHEAIDVHEAIEMYTRNSALIGRQLDWAGTLEPNKVGDLVILSHDVPALEPGDLADVQVDCTIVDGQVAYARAGGPFASLGRQPAAVPAGSGA